MTKKPLQLGTGVLGILAVVLVLQVSQGTVFAKEDSPKPAPAKVAPAQPSPSIKTLGEWFGYSNGVTPGYTGTFLPSAGFSYLHVDDIDIALNGPFMAGGENIGVQFTLHYSDGTSQSSGPIHPFYPNLVTGNVFFMHIPAVYWAQPASGSSDGKHITSIDYTWTADNNPSSRATMIIAAEGFEVANE